MEIIGQDRLGNNIIKYAKLTGYELLVKIRATTGSPDLTNYKEYPINFLAIKCGYIPSGHLNYNSAIYEQGKGLKDINKILYTSEDESENEYLKRGIEEFVSEYKKAFKIYKDKPIGEEICWVEPNDYHPTRSGVVEREIWHKLKLDNEKLNEVLNQDQKKVVRNWGEAFEQHFDYQRIASQEIDKLLESLTKRTLEGKNLVEIPRWWNGENHPLTEFALQCWILEKCPEVDYFSGHENNYGIKNLEKLYPWLWSAGRKLAVLYPIFHDFHYGPNIFQWRTRNKLKGKKWNLYLIAIDIGGILKLPTYRVYKVGITTKKAVVEKDKGQRFHRKYFDFIKVLRFIEYQDGRDAYTREQKVIKDSKDELEFYIKNKYDGKPYENIKLMPKKVAKKMTYEIENYFASSEWIYETIGKENEILEKFDKLTTFYPPDYEDKK